MLVVANLANELCKLRVIFGVGVLRPISVVPGHPRDTRIARNWGLEAVEGDEPRQTRGLGGPAPFVGTTPLELVVDRDEVALAV
jgi:hypothetical protein